MKNNFTTGLAVLLPIVITLLVVSFLINILTNPFLGGTQAFLLNFSFFAAHPDLLNFYSKSLILIGIGITVLIVGFIGKLFLVDALFRLGDYFLHNIPVINKVYKACQDVVHSLFSTESRSFSQVVFVPYPNADTLSIGLVSKDSIPLENTKQDGDLVSVFVPGTPNPSMGFMLCYKRSELIFVDMKVEQAMKFVVSCGVVTSRFSVIADKGIV